MCDDGFVYPKRADQKGRKAPSLKRKIQMNLGDLAFHKLAKRFSMTQKLNFSHHLPIVLIE